MRSGVRSRRSWRGPPPQQTSQQTRKKIGKKKKKRKWRPDAVGCAADIGLGENLLEVEVLLLRHALSLHRRR
eukprot:272678-Rhodomonas_salina.1